MDYQARYCNRCIHENEEKDIYCPVWSLHLIKNYEECNKPASYLHDFIPISKGGLGNDRCKMFVDRGALSNLQIASIEHSFNKETSEAQLQCARHSDVQGTESKP